MAFAFAATYWARTEHIEVNKGEADYLLFRLCEAKVSPAIGALVVAGALAAAFSTTAALIAFVGTASTRYLYAPLRRLFDRPREMSDPHRRRAMAAGMGIGGIACTLLAWSPPALLVVPIIWGWELLTCTLLVPCLLACWWKRATRWGTLASMVVGGAVVLTQGWTGPVWKFPFYGSLIFLPLATLAHLAVSSLTPRDAGSGLLDTWHGFADPSDARLAGPVLPASLAVVSCLLLVLAWHGLH